MRKCTADGSASSVRKRGRLTGFPPRRAPNPSLPLFLVPSVSLCFFWHPKGDPAKNMGPLNGGKPQHVPSVTVSCLLASYVPPPPLLFRVARKLGCRPSAPHFGAPWCGVPQRASAAPLGLAGSWSRVRRWRVCVAGARGVSFLPPAPQRVPPPSVQCAAVVRSLCSVRSLAAACRCSSDGSTLYFNRHIAPSANTGN